MNRHRNHIGGRDFRGIALHAEHAIGRAVVLGVERITIVGFHAVMSVEEVAIAAENATAIGGSVLDAIVGGAFHEAAKRLHGDFILAGSLRLRKRGQRGGGEAYNPSDNQSLSKHVLLLFRSDAGLFYFVLRSLVSMHKAFRSVQANDRQRMRSSDSKVLLKNTVQ